VAGKGHGDGGRNPEHRGALALPILGRSGWWPTELDGPPGQWPKAEMDDMLNTPEQVIVPAGSGPSAFGGPLVERLDAMEMPLWTVHTGSSSGFTVEVEYSSDVPAAMAIAQGVPAGTALVQVSTEEGHPEFGSGALVLLKLPVTYDDEAKHWRRRTS